jgi:hypothetical protein
MATRSEDAKRVLVHYFKMVADKIGMPWDSDYTAELHGIVDDIVEATVEEVDARIRAILRGLGGG